MMDADEIRWVKSLANEMNNLLQVISEATQLLDQHCEQTDDTERYRDMVRSALARSTQVTQSMLERAGEKVSPAFRVVAASEPQRFPRVEATPPPVHKPAPDPDPGGEPLILIVDDEDFVTLLAQRVLSDAGYRVITARNGFEAIETYKKLGDRIDLIILDFTMPILDGAEVFRQLLEIDPKVSVVLSSGFAEQDQLRDMLAKGLRGFIPKPYTQAKLLAQVRSTLDALSREREPNAGH